MTLLTPPMALGASVVPTPAYLQHSARLLRLTMGAVFRRSAAGALSGVSGALESGAGQSGDTTLLNPTTLQVNPGIFVIQGMQSGAQGQYEVVNDATVNLAVPAQDATQYRRAYAAVRVYDSLETGVASSAATDKADMLVIGGTLAASTNPAYPTAAQIGAGTYLLLGEFYIPPTGQTVTFTAYSPRTGIRHGILPVIDDASTRPGHAGAPGTVLNEYRHHPVLGLQRWNGTAWKNAQINPVSFMATSASANWATPLGGQIANAITVNPTTLFGVGIAARVQLDGICLVDLVSGATSDWYYNLVRGDGQLLSQDYWPVSTRRIFHASYTVDVPAGAGTTFYPSLTAPNVAGGQQTIKTYADFSTNRLIANITPLFP